jgi:hypothetical protein
MPLSRGKGMLRTAVTMILERGRCQVQVADANKQIYVCLKFSGTKWHPTPDANGRRLVAAIYRGYE